MRPCVPKPYDQMQNGMTHAHAKRTVFGQTANHAIHPVIQSNGKGYLALGWRISAVSAGYLSALCGEDRLHAEAAEEDTQSSAELT